MHAMQYEITLPADYDMEVVRRRVASRGHALDAWEGLGLKAYLIRERGVHGSPVNQYAPFYLWNSVEGMNSFFWGGGFQGIVDDFGRPSAHQWTGLAYEAGGGAAPPRGWRCGRGGRCRAGCRWARSSRTRCAGRSGSPRWTGRCSRRRPWTPPVGRSSTSRSGTTTHRRPRARPSRYCT